MPSEIDHEVHNGVVLEDFLPLRLALAQGLYRALFRPCAVLERRFHLPAGAPYELHHDQGGEQQGDEQCGGDQIAGNRWCRTEHEPDAGRRE